MVESLAIAKAIAARTRQRLDFNRQCLTEGLANIGGGFFQCMPGGGSLTRSALNFQAGAVTRLSSMVAAAGVAIVLLLFASQAKYVPRAALAGLLLVTAWRIVDWQRFRFCLRATRMDAAVLLATAAAAVFISIEISILIGTCLSFLFFVPRAARLQAHELVVAKGRVVRERYPSDPQCTLLVIFSLEGEMFFGAAPELEEHLAELYRRADAGVRVIVLRLKRARNPDMVCLERLQRFVVDMKARKVPVILCGVRQDFASALANIRSEEWLQPANLFLEEAMTGSSTLHAILHAYTLLAGARCPTCPAPAEGAESAARWHYAV
jgi:SulP family sulfate permease